MFNWIYVVFMSFCDKSWRLTRASYFTVAGGRVISDGTC